MSALSLLDTLKQRYRFRLDFLRIVPTAAGVALVGLAGAVLVGWNLGVFAFPTRLPMAPTTAGLFLVTGLALMAGARSGSRAGFVLLCALVLGAVPLWEGAGQVWLRPPVSELVGNVPTGRMAPVTGLNFLLVSLSLALNLLPYSWTAWLLAGLGTGISWLGAVFVLPYVYGADALIYGRSSIPMALETAGAFLVTGIAVVTMGLHRGLQELWTNRLRIEALNLDLQERLVVARKAEGALRSARDSALEASRAKSEFLAKMSHELRTPLNSIIGFSELLVDQRAGALNPKQVGFVGHVLSSGRHLLELINDILDLARIESGRLVLHSETVHVPEILRDALSAMNPVFQVRGLQVKAEFEPELPPLWADALRLRQIINNLLSNAAKFAAAQGEIEVLARQREGDIEIVVRDDGLGLEPADQERIFGEFEQVDSSISRSQPGTGLGLALTRRLAHSLGGQVGVYSEGLGMGSTFWVRLPVGDRATPPAGGRVALVVEDDPLSAELLCEILTGEGYRVVVAHSAAETLELRGRLAPALITLDVMLPDMDGWQLYTLMQQDPAWNHIPVLVVSVTDRPKFTEVPFLTKPVTREALKWMLRTMLAK